MAARSTPTPTRSGCPTRACRSSTRSSTSAPTPSPSGPTPPGPTSRRCCGPRGLPLFSVDTHRPAGEFDLLAFNLSAELVYTNVLNCIDLAGVPVRAAERRPEHPLIVRRRPLHLQPRAAGRLRRLRRARRRRGGRQRDHRGRRRVEGARAHRGLARARAARAGPHPRRLRAVAVRRRLRRRATSSRSSPRYADVPEPGREAHHRRPGRLAVPQAPARAAHRGRARPPQRRGLPRLHPRAAASARPA